MTRARAVAPGAALMAAGAVLAAALALVPVLGGPAWVRPVGTIGGLAVLLYVAGLAMPWAGALPPSLGLLAVEYLVSLQVRRAPLDAGAPTYAAALFLCAELAWLGLEARREADLGELRQPSFKVEPPAFHLHAWFPGEGFGQLVTHQVPIGSFDGPHPFFGPDGKLL